MWSEFTNGKRQDHLRKVQRMRNRHANSWCSAVRKKCVQLSASSHQSGVFFSGGTSSWLNSSQAAGGPGDSDAEVAHLKTLAGQFHSSQWLLAKEFIFSGKRGVIKVCKCVQKHADTRVSEPDAFMLAAAVSMGGWREPSPVRGETDLSFGRQREPVNTCRDEQLLLLWQAFLIHFTHKHTL